VTGLTRHCEEQGDEAIQLFFLLGGMDCFASLAMTSKTRQVAYGRLPGSEITWLATSLFQMNSTTSAPMVAVMKPAPWSGP
jgi:hypothetical protein